MSGALNGLKETAASFWQDRSASERRVLTVAALAIIAALFYWVAIDPAWSGRAQLAGNLPLLRQQAAEMQALAQQASALGHAATPVSFALSKESVESSLGARGLKAQSVVLSGDLVKVQLASVSYAAVVEWLDQMQKTARLAMVDANIVPQPTPDSVSATLSLRQRQPVQ